tara:strand:+ start:160 stop:1314 length:1155 start_codon:yes stop_codon:yes gene_type:complete
MPASLENQFISDLYTSLIHLSGAELGPVGPLNKIFDGAGNSTGLALSGKRVIVNNYVYPMGFEARDPIEWLDAFFPVGCLQLTLDDNDPTDRIAGTTWQQVAKGRFLVGTGTFTDKNGAQYEFCPGGEEEEARGLRGGSGDIAGEYEVTLTPGQLPAHKHEFDRNALDVQISNPNGSCPDTPLNPQGVVDSTLDFREQLQARFALGQQLNVYPNTNYAAFGPIPGNQPVDQRENSPWLYALDFNFLRGSAAVGVMSEENRNLYIVGDFAERYQFKEMIGIWNGESRFVADVPVNVNPQQIRLNSRRDSTKTPYEYAKELGAIDFDAAQAGVTHDNDTPLLDGDREVLENQENAPSTRDSGLTGEDKAHNNILPSYGVFVWKRIA